MDLQKAKQIAQVFIDLIASACERVEVAGGIRRCKAQPHDVEIVAVAHYTDDTDLFGGVNHASQLEALIMDLLYTERVGLRLDDKVKRNGQHYKRFLFQEEVIELFIAEPSNFGNIYAIRTGDSDFSHTLVTPRNQGGLMPSNMRQKDGYLWRDDERLTCQHEEDFFRALGVINVPPAKRNAVTAQWLLRHPLLVQAGLKGGEA